jgi:hypothetical protein
MKADTTKQKMREMYKLEKELSKNEDMLSRVVEAWNGEDECGQFEGEPIRWEDTIATLEDEIAELVKSINTIDERY